MGTGKNAEGLSARELAYVNGAVSGLAKRVAARKAGYKWPDRMVELLNRRERVVSAIERRQRAAGRKAGASREEIIEFHLGLMRGEGRLTARGRTQQPNLKHSQDSAKELADMLGYRVKGEAADPMVVKIEMGCTEEIREILQGGGTDRQLADALLRMAKGKGLHK